MGQENDLYNCLYIAQMVQIMKGVDVMEYVYHTTTPKQSRKKLKLRLRFIFFLCFLLFLSWASYELIRQFGYMQEKKKVLHELQIELDQAKVQNLQSSQELLRLHDTEYIEQKIRKDLNYTKPGETIFFVPRTTEQ